jgi:hypothetical protein
MTIGAPRRVRLRGSIAVAVSATAVLVAVALLLPRERRAALLVYVLLLALLVVGILVRTTSAEGSVAGPLPFDLALRALETPRPPVPPELRAVDQLLRSSTIRGVVLHYQLRPKLQRIARDRLSAGHGITLEDGDAARALLSEDAWALLRSVLEPPADRSGPGLAPEALARIVSALERLS